MGSRHLGIFRRRFLHNALEPQARVRLARIRFDSPAGRSDRARPGFQYLDAPASHPSECTLIPKIGGFLRCLRERAASPAAAAQQAPVHEPLISVASARHLAGSAPVPCGPLSSLHYVGVTAREDSACWGARFDARRRLTGGSWLTATRGNNLDVKWNFSKKTNKNNDLRRKSDHICVLFVQHPSEKGASHAFRSGSFVACAEVLGNCDLATEGGIPRSSR